MSLRISFPGRFGDLLWALPTVRTLSEKYGGAARLYIAGEFASIAPLIQEQPYIADVIPLASWGLTPPNEWQAPIPDAEGTVIHLGYRGWPTKPLPYAVAEQAGVEIDINRPWIQIEGPYPPTEIAIGFTEAWFELKLGLVIATLNDKRGDPPYLVLTPRGTRWRTEARGVAVYETTWLEAAGVIRNSDLFFGDCSALHVLACAMGKPVVLMEPMEARWNPIFYPYGMDGPHVTVVKGNDGRPTFDARACAAALKKALQVS